MEEPLKLTIIRCIAVTICVITLTVGACTMYHNYVDIQNVQSLCEKGYVQKVVPAEPARSYVIWTKGE